MLDNAHTLWSWAALLHDAQGALEQAQQAEGQAGQDAQDAQQAVSDAAGALTSDGAHQQRRCKLFRVRELALFYACQQGALNRYALGGYGGAVRSYGRWRRAALLCNAQLQAADAFQVDGRSCEEDGTNPEPTGPVGLYPDTPVCPIPNGENKDQPMVGRIVKMNEMAPGSGYAPGNEHYCAIPG